MEVTGLFIFLMSSPHVNAEASRTSLVKSQLSAPVFPVCQQAQ